MSSFLVSTISAEISLLWRVFVIHLLSFLKLAWCSDFSKWYDNLVNIYFCFSLLEIIVRECLTFLFFHRSCCYGFCFFLNYMTYFVESARKNGYYAVYEKKKSFLIAVVKKTFYNKKKNGGSASTN